MKVFLSRSTFHAFFITAYSSFTKNKTLVYLMFTRERQSMIVSKTELFNFIVIIIFHVYVNETTVLLLHVLLSFYYCFICIFWSCICIMGKFAFSKLNCYCCMFDVDNKLVKWTRKHYRIFNLNNNQPYLQEHLHSSSVQSPIL